MTMCKECLLKLGMPVTDAIKCGICKVCGTPQSCTPKGDTPPEENLDFTI